MRLLIGSARATLVTVTVLLAFGCSASSATKSPSGLTGRVLIGPTCPVERAGQRCQRAFAAQIVVFRRRDHRRVTSFRSGSDGRFRVMLEPGRYVLAAAKAGTPRLAPVDTTVRTGRFTTLTLVFDTGIR